MYSWFVALTPWSLRSATRPPVGPAFSEVAPPRRCLGATAGGPLAQARAPRRCEHDALGRAAGGGQAVPQRRLGLRPGRIGGGPGGGGRPAGREGLGPP